MKGRNEQSPLPGATSGARARSKGSSDSTLALIAEARALAGQARAALEAEAEPMTGAFRPGDEPVSSALDQVGATAEELDRLEAEHVERCAGCQELCRVLPLVLTKLGVTTVTARPEPGTAEQTELDLGLPCRPRSSIRARDLGGDWPLAAAESDRSRGRRR